MRREGVRQRMKIKKGFLLRQLDGENMVVAVGEAGRTFSGVIRLNDSAAWCWNQMKEETTKEALIEKMCAEFDGLSPEIAKADLDELLETIAMAVEA